MMPPVDQNQATGYTDEVPDFSEPYFADFLTDPDEDYYSIDHSLIPSNDATFPALEYSSMARPDNTFQSSEQNSTDFVRVSGELQTESDQIEEENISGLEAVDFHFVDQIGSSSIEYSTFDIAEEISKPMVQEDEPSMLSEAMKRTNYERKFSASLYAFNGITECLQLKLGKTDRCDRSGQMTRLRTACRLNQEEMTTMMTDSNAEQEKVKDDEDHDGELSLWSSIDLPPLCFVNGLIV